ncbi:unnamed protein product [Ambrosiozyma monospora]|uniref:Unnamed protein product n=1 Tax=Ambrosiozyma monospora TaxID=43982 RepID=A0A9W7DJQ6_AMBMO|nr:unnamed protein product [Ambrosiozyma monospora]
MFMTGDLKLQLFLNNSNSHCKPKMKMMMMICIHQEVQPPSGFNSSIVPTPQEYLDQSGQPSAPVTARKLHTPTDGENPQQNSSSTLNQYATAHDFLNTAKLDTGKEEGAGDTETIDSNIPTIHADNDFDESKKDIAGLDDINENSPAGKGKTKTDSEIDFPSIDDLQFAEAEKRVSMTPGAFPSIENDYPPLAEPEDDDETSDDEFHDTVQTPSAGKKPVASSKLEEAKAVKSPSFSDDFPQPSGAGFYNNPFSANAPQQQESLHQQSSSGIQEKSAVASKTPVNSNSVNLFDDLGLEEATPEEGANFDNNADFGFSNNSFTDNAAFTFSQSNVVPTAAAGSAPATGAGNGGNDDWEQLFAGFGNDPNLKPATTEKDAGFSFGSSDGAGTAPPPSYDFSSTPVDPSLGTTSKKTLDQQPSAFSQRQSVSSYSRSQQLAIEELQGMGFDEESVLDALKKNNWKLDMATNYLLDSA